MPHTILVVEDNPITRKMMLVALRTAGYVAFGAEDGQSALTLVEREQPDLVVQDLMLPDIDGIALAREIRALPHGRDCLLVALSGLASKLDEARALGPGFAQLLYKPIEPAALVDLLDSLLPQGTSGEWSIGANRLLLLVDDDPVQCKLHRLQLEERGFRVSTASDGQEALAQARRNVPDAIVSDHLMPDMDGFELCLAIRADPVLAHVPFVLASASGVPVEASDQRLARSVGVNALTPRTANLDQIIVSIVACLDGTPPPMPTAAPDAEVLKAQYTARVARQLEEQARLRQSAAREAAAKSAQLSIMTAVAGVMAQNRDLTAVLHEMLARTLDTAGVPMGAIYLADPEGHPRLACQQGYPIASAERLGDFFGRPGLLDTVLSTGHPKRMPSTEFGEPAREPPGRAGSARDTPLCMLLPLVAAGERLGVLVIASARRDLGHDWVEIAMAVGVQMAQAVAHARSMAQLCESEQHYRTLFEDVPVGLYRTTPDGQILDVNAAMVQILGYPDPLSLLSMNIADVYGHQPAVHDSLARVFDFEITRHDGEPIWVRTTTRAVRGADGSVVSFEGSLEDVTAHRRAAHERELALARERSARAEAESARHVAETANATKSTFLAVMSHELRTPLNAIGGYVDLIQHGIHGPVTTNQAEALSRVKHSAQHLLKMISEILEFTQIDAGRANLRCDPVPLHQILTHAEALVAPQFREKGLEFTVEPCLASWAAHADQERLTQVVVNLLTNALKFTPPDGRVRLACEAESATVTVRVVDTGPGIEAENLDRIFEPFYQVDRSLTRTQGGIGLGLAISRDLVRGMHGDIAVTSTPGLGASFAVTLPRVV
jgi:PAS domain S-box-containing protein